ncbi:MAG: hypothetical protein QNJ46_01130 [Leptolyngbyaceae cyanobacterium MO_188.B28]|nr:hypothetical protein [Leptolyngbyaceae cyanobacterium MO_188.B28]
MLRIALGILLAICLSACGLVGGGPPKAVVESAIALQFSQTQQEISQLLTPKGNRKSTFTVSQVKVNRQTPMAIQNAPAYRVEGTFHLKLNLRTRRVSDQTTPFEVYLQPQPDGQTWRLARPLANQKDDESGWTTYPIESPT